MRIQATMKNSVIFGFLLAFYFVQANGEIHDRIVKKIRPDFELQYGKNVKINYEDCKNKLEAEKMNKLKYQDLITSNPVVQEINEKLKTMKNPKKDDCSKIFFTGVENSNARAQVEKNDCIDNLLLTIDSNRNWILEELIDRMWESSGGKIQHLIVSNILKNPAYECIVKSKNILDLSLIEGKNKFNTCVE